MGSVKIGPYGVIKRIKITNRLGILISITLLWSPLSSEFIMKKDDIAYGRNADAKEYVEGFFDKSILQKFEIFSYRNAAGILASSFPEQFEDILRALNSFQITEQMIRIPGGSKGPIAKYVDTLFVDNWRELRISADLHVKLLDANKKEEIVRQYVKEG